LQTLKFEFQVLPKQNNFPVCSFAKANNFPVCSFAKANNFPVCSFAKANKSGFASLMDPGARQMTLR
jgi:hypothetical protein